MSSIVENQRAAYLSRAHHAARNLTLELANLSEPQRVALLGIIAKNSNTPADIVMLGEPGDWREANAVAGSHLRTTHDNRWEIGSGCHLVIEELPR